MYQSISKTNETLRWHEYRRHSYARAVPPIEVETESGMVLLFRTAKAKRGYDGFYGPVLRWRHATVSEDGDWSTPMF